jgi:hypothetical protein
VVAAGAAMVAGLGAGVGDGAAAAGCVAAGAVVATGVAGFAAVGLAAGAAQLAIKNEISNVNARKRNVLPTVVSPPIFGITRAPDQTPLSRCNSSNINRCKQLPDGRCFVWH